MKLNWDLPIKDLDPIWLWKFFFHLSKVLIDCLDQMLHINWRRDEFWSLTISVASTSLNTYDRQA